MKALTYALKFTLLLLLGLPAFLHAQESNIVVISGSVNDQESGAPLIGVSVVIKGTVAGTATDNKGAFSIKTKLKFPFTLVFSMVGFEPKEYKVTGTDSKLNIGLLTQTVLGKEVVVTASRVEEAAMKSPVAIQKLDIRAIKESPAPSFYDALENVKGVQMTTSSLTFKVPNTRGFNIPNNFRFMQLVDGVDMQAATLGVPLGNAIGPTELDIASVEITPGAASALYGMNAINGMANLITKSPFLYQGLSVYQKVGVNHVDGTDYNPSILTETAIRYAKAFHNKFAFKINASYMRGTDWLSNTRTDQNPYNLSSSNPAFPEFGGGNNPAYDAWNRYGDENNNNVPVSVLYKGKNQTFNIRRTGYWEKDLINPKVENLKADLALHYRVNEKAELSYAFRYGRMDGVFQRGNKIQLDGVTVMNHKVELRGPSYFARAYVSIENTGNSYNLKPLADNLDLNNGTNDQWGARFKTSLQDQIDKSGGNVDLAAAMNIARNAADAGRVQPGTPAFEALKKTIIGINNWDIGSVIPGAPTTGGAWLSQKSRMYNLDGQWDLSEKIKVFNLLVGADLRVYEVIPDGNNFVDFKRPLAERTQPGGNNIHYTKYGFFAQATKTFFDEKLKLTGSLRFDQNLEFQPKINPRFAVVYTLAEKHNFRASYQNGFRFPALFEALSFVNNGNVRRVGGLDYINEGLGYLDNSYTLASINDFNAAVNKDVANGINKNDAALKNKGVLSVTNLSPTRPERINSFEIGYRSALLDNKLVLDFDAYYNIYDGFLGQVEVAVPSSGKVGSDAAVLDMLTRSKQTRYRVFTNAKNDYHNYGSSLGVTYNFYKKFTISGNLNYNNIVNNKEKDVFVTAFNTPKWVTNLSIGNRELLKNFGANIVWRWQDTFLWESPLANGIVPAYSVIDAQVTYRIPKIKGTIKVGASNIFNNRYIQYAAGPTIGGLYYAAFTLEGLLTK